MELLVKVAPTAFQLGHSESVMAVIDSDSLLEPDVLGQRLVSMVRETIAINAAHQAGLTQEQIEQVR